MKEYLSTSNFRRALTRPEMPMRRPAVRRRIPKPRLPLDVTTTPLPDGAGFTLGLGRMLWDLEVQQTLKELGLR